MTTRDRRQRVRVILPWTVRGAVDRRYDVQVIDLSPAGAMIEHAERFSPGETRLLLLWVPGADLCLRAQLIWSQMNRMQVGAGRKGELRFRSGVHFPDLSEADAAHLRRYLATFGTPKSDAAQAAARPPALDAPPIAGSSDSQRPVDRPYRLFSRRPR